MRLIITLLALLPMSWMQAQDLSQALDQKSVELNGSLRLQSGFYGFQGEQPRSSRYHYSIYARPVLSIYGMRFPITIAYYAQEARLSHPFNRFGVSPYYKWAKLHLGHRSMRLSKYTLSGKVFLGAGLELTPGKFRFSALYGKLQNHLARRDTLVIGVQQLPSYDRFVMGGKIGYGTRKNHIDLIVVRATDNSEQSIRNVSNSFLPEASLATGISWQVQPFKKLTVSGEIAGSVFTLDQRSKNDFLDPDLVEKLSNLIAINNSSRLSIAGEAKADFRLRAASFGIQYRRVEPFYRSLGTLFYNSDYQDWRFNSRLNLLRSKLQASLSIGLRQDNLRNIQISTNRRFISNGNLSIRPTERLYIQLNYSNFQIYEDPILVDVDDFFRYATLTNHATLHTQYRWNSGNSIFIISPAFSWQSLNDNSTGARVSSDYESFSSRLNFQWKSRPGQFFIQPSFQYFKYFFQDRTQVRYGLGLSAGKPFFKKRLNLRSSVKFNYNDVNSLRNGHIIQAYINASILVVDRQKISFSLSLIDRKSVLSGNLMEWRSQLGYGINF